MKNVILAMKLLTLSLVLLVTPTFAQEDKPLQSFTDAMDALRHSDYKGAVDHFRKAIEERPSMAMAHFYLGLSLYKQEDYDGALGAYRELIKLDPDDSLAHYQIAKIHLISKRDSLAIEEYRWLRSMAEKKSNAPAKINGVEFLDKNGVVIDDFQKHIAAELAQYLLDLIPRETAAQNQLPDSQIVYIESDGSIASLKPLARREAAGDSGQKSTPIAPGNPSPNASSTGVAPPGDLRGVTPSPSKPSPESSVGGSATSPLYPMTANLRPTILYREKAKYTNAARVNLVQGTVALSVVFGDDKTIRNIRVIRGLPDGLTRNAIEAARVIRFDPAIKDGSSVSVRGVLEYTFNLY